MTTSFQDIAENIQIWGLLAHWYFNAQQSTNLVSNHVRPNKTVSVFLVGNLTSLEFVQYYTFFKNKNMIMLHDSFVVECVTQYKKVISFQLPE